MKELRVLLLGDLGAGKTTTGNYLQHHGIVRAPGDAARYYHFSVSDWLVAQVGRAGRQALGQLAGSLVAHHGPQVWDELARTHYRIARQRQPYDGYIMTGPRRPEEVAAFRQRDVGDSLVLYLTAGYATRLARAAKAAHERGAFFDAAGFAQRNDAERYGRNESGINLAAVRDMADLIVTNEAFVPALSVAIIRND